ncbi:hypothetical protein A2U01_0091912, partial [Trifolium medium]|nr:hypothetical protein [Trifolium medium]
KPPTLTRVPSGASPPHEHHGSAVTCTKDFKFPTHHNCGPPR